MSDNFDYQTAWQPPAPNPDLKALDRLVGAWRISGEAEGTVSYEWMEGGFFLIQRVDLEHGDHVIRGIEIIGHEQRFMEEPGAEIRSRYYDNMGSTFDYVYEADGDTLVIWGGEKGSPAYYKGTFNAAGDVLTGRWVYPDGGGYEATATRIE